jgi:hypothetical protein
MRRVPKSVCLLLQIFQTVNQRFFPLASTVRATRSTSLARIRHQLKTWTKGSSHQAEKSLSFLTTRPSGKSPLRKRHALSKPLSQHGALLLDLPICFRQRYGVQVHTSRNSPLDCISLIIQTHMTITRRVYPSLWPCSNRHLW